jgi:hypothetical protein
MSLELQMFWAEEIELCFMLGVHDSNFMDRDCKLASYIKKSGKFHIEWMLHE